LHLAVDLLFHRRVESANPTVLPTWSKIAAIVIGSAGALTYLFLMVIIVGHRRRRGFERVLFFLSLALFGCYAGELLLVNVRMHYSSGPSYTELFALLLIGTAGSFLPGLIKHVHRAFAATRPGAPSGPLSRGRIVWLYRPFVYLAGVLVFGISARGFSFPDRYISSVWLTLASFFIMMSVARGAMVGFQLAMPAGREFKPVSRNAIEPYFYRFLGWSELAIAILIMPCILYFALHAYSLSSSVCILILLLAGIVPGAAIVYAITAYDIFEISAQRNLVYAVSAAFLALIYLTVVRRVSAFGLSPFSLRKQPPQFCFLLHSHFLSRFSGSRTSFFCVARKSRYARCRP
jgi:hypothetical protein